MNEEEIKRNSDIETRKQIMLDVEEGKKTLYWKHIERKIKTWIYAEEKYLESFKKVGINEKNMSLYNTALERLALMKQFFQINDLIIRENMTWIERMVEPVKDTFQYIKTFVGIKD